MRSPLMIGLFHPLNLGMLGLAASAGLVAAWWLFPVGLVLWVVMVLAVSRDPSVRISHELQSREPVAQRFQPYFDRIERAQISVFNSLASAPAPTRNALEPAREELEALSEQAYQLCRRMTTLENYRLVSESTSDLQADMRRVEDAIERTSDAQVKQQYEESRRALLERIDRTTPMVQDLDRAEAQLLALSSEMDSIVTEMIRLQAAGRSEAMRGVPALVDKMRGLSAPLAESVGEPLSSSVDG